MNAETRLSALTVIGPDRTRTRPLHDESVAAVTMLPNLGAVIVFRSELTGQGHNPHIRVVELAAGPVSATWTVTAETVTPMPNTCGPAGQDRQTARSVLHYSAPVRLIHR